MIAKRLAALVALAISVSSFATYGYATTFLAHDVTVNNFQGLGGGFTSDSGQWSISPNSGLVNNGAGLVVFPEDFPATGTQSGSPSTFNGFGVALVTSAITAADWVLQLKVTNASDIQASKTWSLTFRIDQDGFIATAATFYFATPSTLSSNSFIVLISLDLGTGQVLTTPVTYTAAIKTFP